MTRAKAIALDYGYAVAFRVPQLPLRVRWDAEAAAGEPPPASGLRHGWQAAAYRGVTGVRAA